MGARSLVGTRLRTPVTAAEHLVTDEQKRHTIVNQQLQLLAQWLKWGRTRPILGLCYDLSPPWPKTVTPNDNAKLVIFVVPKPPKPTSSGGAPQTPLGSLVLPQTC